MNAIDFLYHHLGQYIAPSKELMKWATSKLLKNNEGKDVSFCESKSAVLASERGVWVQTSCLAPDDIPPHIHWGVGRVFRMAVQSASDLGTWYGIWFSQTGPARFVSVHSTNMPGNEVFAFYFDSGRKPVFWKPALVNELISLAGAVFPAVDSKTIFSLVDHAAGRNQSGRALKLDREQERVAKKIFNILAREQPEALLPERRDGLRAAIDAVVTTEGEPDV